MAIDDGSEFGAFRHSHSPTLRLAPAGVRLSLAACAVWSCSAYGAELATASSREEAILAVGGPNAATELKAEARCDPLEPTSFGHLNWEPAEHLGREQRVDVTMFRDGFQTGRFTTFGPLSADQTEEVLTAGEPSINYYWRVLTRTGQAWAPSETGRLPWPVCPRDSTLDAGLRDLRLADDLDFERVTSDEGNLLLDDPTSGEEDVDLEEAGPNQHEISIEQLGPDSRGIAFTDVNPDFSRSPQNGGSGGRVNGLAGVPGNNHVFYAASEHGGLYRTEDRGKNWERLDDHLPASTWDVEVNPTNPGIVYATSFYDGRVETFAGINVSRDGGDTWEHPTTAIPPTEFNCVDVIREEPLAFGISINPRSPNHVYIGYGCGLAVSRDRGRTWQFVDPEQDLNNFSAIYFDVVAHRDEQGNDVVDICGNEGHFRSEDQGHTWRAGSGLPSGTCSITVSPDESYVLFAVVGTKIYQSIDGGDHWEQNISNPRPMGRIPFVATNQRSNLRIRPPFRPPFVIEKSFDLWFGDVTLHRFACRTQLVPQPARGEGGPRCPANPVPVDFTRGAHVDVGDLAFDTNVQAASDPCPLIFSNDGGVYRNLRTSSPACHEPTWTQPDVSPHALWLWALAGAHQNGEIEEDLYIGTQDNGVFATTEGGESKPDWNNEVCCDAFDIAATPTGALLQSAGPPLLRLFDRGFNTLERSILPDNPDGLSGGLIGFKFPETIDEWGEQRFVLVTFPCDVSRPSCVPGPRGDGDDGLFITSDNGVRWTELGNASEPRGMCAVQAAFQLRSFFFLRIPVFYVQVGGCETNIFGDRAELWKFVGTNPNGRWQRVEFNLQGLTREQIESSRISIFAVDRSNADRLYAALLTPGQIPRMIFSTNGGVTWNQDEELDTLMQGDGVFRYQTRLGGPTTEFLFPGYAQASLLAFDSRDRNLIVAGGHDSGVFLSQNGGRNWRLVTDPFNPARLGIPHLTRPRFAYFDHDLTDATDVYIGTQGRGVWRMRITPRPIRVSPGPLAAAAPGESTP